MSTVLENASLKFQHYLPSVLRMREVTATPAAHRLLS